MENDFQNLGMKETDCTLPSHLLVVTDQWLISILIHLLCSVLSCSNELIIVTMLLIGSFSFDEL